MSDKTYGASISLFVILQITIVALRLMGVVEWDCITVFAPSILVLTLFCIGAFILTILLVVHKHF